MHKYKLIILDYSTGIVHFYDAEQQESIDIDWDSVVDSLGYNLNNVNYMVSTDIEVFKHKGVVIV